MGLDLRKVEHFVAVAEERSMTRAAARLRLSQQALSMSMRALERELGVPLLDRSSRGVALLASGEALYADAVPLLAAATAALLLPVRGLRNRIRKTKGAELERVYAAIRGDLEPLSGSPIARRAETVASAAP